MKRKTSLHQPYVSLGLVCDGSQTGCAPTSHRQGLTFFLTTPVDGARSLHLYDIKLQLKGVSKPLPSSWFSSLSQPAISHLAAYEQLTFAVVNDCIVVFYRLIPFTVWRRHTAFISRLSVIGDVLVSVDCESDLIVWKLPDNAKDLPDRDGFVCSHIVLPFDFVVSSITHPHTYINKVLLGAKDGRCLLVNLRTKAVIHIFKPFPSPITVLEASPVVDVVAVGTQDGSVHLHNFREDNTVATLRHAEASASASHNDGHNSSGIIVDNPAVRSISFRTDGIETVVTADASGNLFVWDLNERCLRSQASGIHSHGVMFADFIAGEPVLVTTGCADNAIKVHVFDETKEEARVLRSREGHHLPPTLVRFCGYDGMSMVSAGMDREIRLVSAVHDARNRSFAQPVADPRGQTSKKRCRRQLNVEVGDHRSDLKRLLPSVISMASQNAREKDSEFANIVTVHSGLMQAYSWRFEQGASHKHILVPPPYPTVIQLAYKAREKESANNRKKLQAVLERSEQDRATCVTMSPCGNFGIIGYCSGRIHCFNLQSGAHQGVYGDNPVSPKLWTCAHKGPVASLCVDGCGDFLASVGSADRTLKFWNLKTRKPFGECLHLPSNVGQMIWCETSDLLAVSMDDFSILVYDVPTRRLARAFKGHMALVVDICFDVQGRRILSASMDGTIRTWDLPSGCLVDVLHCVDAPTSLAVSPNGDFLASTHANSLSIRLWLDSTRFGHVRESGGNEALVMDGFVDDGLADADTTISEEGQEDSQDGNEGSSQARPLSDTIITLSSRPTNAWTVLSNLREISERNKPVEAPKKGENAPFFLPTVKGIEFKLDTNISDEEETENGSKAKKERNSFAEDAEYLDLSNFEKMVIGGKLEEAERVLKDGDASTVDVNIRGMTNRTCIQNTARLFIMALQNRSCFELTQAHLAVFLKSQGKVLASDEEGLSLLGELAELQHQAWTCLRSTFDSVTCISSFLSGQV